MLAKEVFINPSKIELEDGNKKDEERYFYGGISYIGECLDNFLGELKKDFDKISILELLTILDKSNVKIKDIKQVIKW